MDDREQQRKIRYRLAVLRHAEEASGNVDVARTSICERCSLGPSALMAYRAPARAALDEASARLLGTPDAEFLRDLARYWCCGQSAHDGTP